MNEKEAREIVALRLGLAQKVGMISPYDVQYYQAKGYLEAIEKAKVLENYIRSLITPVGSHLARSHQYGQICEACKPRHIIEQWEEER